MSKRDLRIPDLGEATENESPADAAVIYARGLAIDALQWYAGEKKRKQWPAKLLRALAILAMALAGIIPILTEIYKDAQGAPLISPAWASVSLAVAGTLVLFDRFFGLSTGWLRFIDAMMQIRREITAFDLDIAVFKADRPADGSDPAAVDKVFERCRELVDQVNAVIIDETGEWNREFRDALKHLDEKMKKREPTPSPNDGASP